MQNYIGSSTFPGWPSNETVSGCHRLGVYVSRNRIWRFKVVCAAIGVGAKREIQKMLSFALIEQHIIKARS